MQQAMETTQAQKSGADQIYYFNFISKQNHILFS